MRIVKSKEKKYFNAFNLIDEIGPISFKKILTAFDSLERAWQASPNEFIRAGLKRAVAEQIKRKRPKIDPESELEKIIKEGIDIITIKDKDYPKLLKEIYAPPAILYIRGQFRPEDKFCLGVVGPRKVSFYGKQIAPCITANLAQAGLTIVSGLAKGVDALAHQTALKVNGRTIAVLGSGLDRKSIYPAINKRLAEEISQNGVVISEYPINTEPIAQNFPQRNRIISGLSLGVLVIEASEKSGALITAKDALEQNREVFAIPGSILSANSIGTNNLIKMGAKLVSNVNDILEELNLNEFNYR